MSCLVTWGITSPTKPMIPLMETITAVSSVLVTINMTLISVTLTP